MPKQAILREAGAELMPRMPDMTKWPLRGVRLKLQAYPAACSLPRSTRMQEKNIDSIYLTAFVTTVILICLRISSQVGCSNCKLRFGSRVLIPFRNTRDATAWVLGRVLEEGSMITKLQGDCLLGSANLPASETQLPNKNQDLEETRQLMVTEFQVPLFKMSVNAICAVAWSILDLKEKSMPAVLD